MLGGVALIDAEGDGKLDIFFVNGAALQDKASRPDKLNPAFWNRLFRNNGDGTFTDVTAKAGIRGSRYGQGVAVADYNNDGYSDLYITNFGANVLYRNNGDGTFKDVTEAAGVAAGGWSTGAGFIDIDGDGHLDLFVARYLDWDFSKNKVCGGADPKLRAYCHPNEFSPVSHLLYRNLGNGKFEDISQKAKISGAPGKGLGVAFHDYDRDGRPDIFVANDSFPQQLFRNNGDGSFQEVALSAGLAYDSDGQTFAGMGTDFADCDGDGWPDVFVNALANQGYALFRNEKGTFNYSSGPAGITAITKVHSGWGAHFLDYDNDGRRDIFVAQGHVMDNIELTQPGFHYRERLLLMRNTGSKFVDVSEQAGTAFQVPLASRGAAFGDLDDDGRIDIVVSTNDGSPKILKNETSRSNHWLVVNTVGTISNRDGIGAVLRLVPESGKEQFGFVSTAGSYLSASDKRVHFGLGSDRRVELLEIRWPSGIVQTWLDIPADRIFTATEQRATGDKPLADR